MNGSKFEFAELVELLRRSENDPKVRNFFGQAMSCIERDEYYGSLEFKLEGVDVVFQEAPWVLPTEAIDDPKKLYVAAFHLRRNGHEGYSGYSGQLPHGLAFGDTEAEALRKMGRPLEIGGGGVSKLLGRIPVWFRYPLGDSVLHFQLDANGRVEMVTILVAEVL